MIKRRARLVAGFALAAVRAAAAKLRELKKTEQMLTVARRRTAASTVIAGQRVLITGSTRGIGRALAEGFVRQGASVAVHGRHEAQARELADALGKLRPSQSAVVTGVGADLSVVGAGRTLVERAAGELGGLDLVINNAAIHDPRRKQFWETSSEEMHEIMKVNLIAAFDVSAAAAAIMLKQDAAGRIINISSDAANPAYVSNSGTASYGISKIALEGLSHYLAAESQDVTVVTLRPDTLDTDMVSTLFTVDRRLRMLPPESMVPPVFHLACAPREQVHGKLFEQLQLMQILGTAGDRAVIAGDTLADDSSTVTPGG